MSLREINKKLGSKEAKIRYSMYNLNFNPNSPLFCTYCKKKLGLIRMLKKSIWVKPGSEYVVKCKYCNNLNIRIKGKIGEDIDKNWDRDGF